MRGDNRPAITRLVFEEVLRQHLMEAGASIHPLVASPGFKSLDRIQRLDRLAQYAAHELRNRPEGRHLALRIGQQGRLSRFGVFGHAVLSCASVGEAMRMILKHLWIVHEQSRHAAYLRADKEKLILVYTNPPVTPETPHFRTELFYSSVISCIGELSGGRLQGIELELAHDPGCSVTEYEGILGVKVTFHTQEYRLLVPRALAEEPLPASFITHSEAYLTQCDDLLSQMKHTTGIAAQLRRIILRQKPGDRDIKTICNKIALSERTLRRRLRAEGTSFQQVLDEVKNHLAWSYLRETQLSVGDIASLLGFCDAPTFRKAFKKWNAGQTPGGARIG